MRTAELLNVQWVSNKYVDADRTNNHNLNHNPNPDPNLNPKPNSNHLPVV